MTTKDICQTLVAIGIAIGMIFGAITYFATAKDLQLTQMMIQQEIQGNRIEKIQSMIWQLEEKYTVNGKLIDIAKWSENDRKRYKELTFELEMAKKKFEKMK